jgi:hypothetical protein
MSTQPDELMTGKAGLPIDNMQSEPYVDDLLTTVRMQGMDLFASDPAKAKYVTLSRLCGHPSRSRRQSEAR